MTRFRCAVLSAVKHDYVARGLASHPRFELVVVADDQAMPVWAHERNQQLADAFGIPYVRDVERALRDFDVEVAVVSSEAERHVDLSVRALRAGKHVVLLERSAGAFSVPSKTLSYLCAGRPVVGLMPAENLAAEVRYLQGPGRVSFERPYGLAWLLQLATELREFAAAVKAAGKPVQLIVGEGYNHFEIIETLEPVRRGVYCGAVGWIDADRGIGHLAAREGMTRAIEKAKQVGVAMVNVQRSHHLGAASIYAMMALEHHMIGFVTTNTGGPSVAPYGGRSGALANHPLAWAIPSRGRARHWTSSTRRDSQVSSPAAGRRFDGPEPRFAGGAGASRSSLASSSDSASRAGRWMFSSSSPKGSRTARSEKGSFCHPGRSSRTWRA